MLHSVASDLGLHCMPMSHKKDAGLICYFFVSVKSVQPDELYKI